MAKLVCIWPKCDKHCAPSALVLCARHGKRVSAPRKKGRNHD